MPTDSKYESQKVSRSRLSRLMRWVLLNTGAGIDRGQIAAGYYGLERRYVGHWTDPCMSARRQRLFDRRYHRVQAAISKALKRLEARGLVGLVRHKRYVKRVELSEAGRAIAQELNGDMTHERGPY